MRIEVKAYAKINWALWITGRRPDGYHELDMLMQPVSLCDDLTFEEGRRASLHVAGGLADDPNNLVPLRRARSPGADRGAAARAFF